MTVLFKPLAVADELRRLSVSARAWLKDRDDLRLRAAADELEGWFQSPRPSPFDWKLDEPIVTVDSTAYKGGGAHAVHGELRFRWRCERTGDPTILSAANGATDVEIVRSTGKKVNAYHFDLCTGGVTPPSTVPHCFSHTQVSFASNSFPRFPSMVLLPSDVLEMLLFELWPSDWPETAVGQRNNLLRHHRGQRTRLGRVAKAFRQLATKPYPLISLHSALPAPIPLY